MMFVVATRDNVTELFEGVIIPRFDWESAGGGVPGWKCRRCGWTIGTEGLPPTHQCMPVVSDLARGAAQRLYEGLGEAAHRPTLGRGQWVEWASGIIAAEIRDILRRPNEVPGSEVAGLCSQLAEARATIAAQDALLLEMRDWVEYHVAMIAGTSGTELLSSDAITRATERQQNSIAEAVDASRAVDQERIEAAKEEAREEAAQIVEAAIMDGLTRWTKVMIQAVADRIRAGEVVR